MRKDGKRRCDWCLQVQEPGGLLPVVCVWGFRLDTPSLGNTTNLICGECLTWINETVERRRRRALRTLTNEEYAEAVGLPVPAAKDPVGE